MRIFKLSVLLAMMSVVMCAGARSFKVDDYRFTVLDEDARTVGISAAAMLRGVVELPKTVTYEDEIYTVTEINRYAFDANIYLEALIIPESVTKMGSGALTGCSPKMIVFGKNLVQVDEPEGITTDIAVFMATKKPEYARQINVNNSFSAIAKYGASNVSFYAEPYITDNGMIYMVGDKAATLIGLFDTEVVKDFVPGDLTLDDGRTVRVERLATNSLMGCTLGEVRIDDGIDFFVERDAFDVADVVYFGDRTQIGIHDFPGSISAVEPWKNLVTSDLTMRMHQNIYDMWIAAYIENLNLDICGYVTNTLIKINNRLVIGKDVGKLDYVRLNEAKEVVFEESEDNLTVNNSLTGGLSFGHAKSIYIGRDIIASASPDSRYPFQSIGGVIEAVVSGYATTMPVWSFYNCAKLRHLTLGENMSMIPENCISELPALERIDCQAAVPPVCDATGMQDINYEKCHLYVPEESYEAYRTTEPWSRFVYINDINGAVETISADNAAVVATEWYDMQGRRLEHQPSTGVAIRRDRAADGTVTCHKVIGRE